MDTQKQQTDELQKFKDDLSKFSKEQLVEMLVTYSILNSQLANQNKTNQIDFINAIKNTTNDTVASLDNMNKSITTIFDSFKELKKENIGLWVAAIIEGFIILWLFFLG